jgi:hypothetical protein
MEEERNISGFARRFVARKLEQIERQSYRGADWYHEFAENFTNGVDGLAARVKRGDLRDHLLAEARKTRNYVGEEPARGSWTRDVEARSRAAEKYGAKAHELQAPEITAPKLSR